MRIATEVLVEKYKDHLFAAAFNVCKNAADADDVVQDTFLQYHTTNRQFENEQHIRAWLIRVAINKAKNINLSFWRQKGVPLEEYMETLTFETPEAQTLFTEVMKLPEKYRIVIHLFYYLPGDTYLLYNREDYECDRKQREGQVDAWSQTAQKCIKGGMGK